MALSTAAAHAGGGYGGEGGRGSHPSFSLAGIRAANNTGRIQYATVLELAVPVPLAHTSLHDAGQEKMHPSDKRRSSWVVGLIPIGEGSCEGVASILCLLASAFALIIAIYLSDAMCWRFNRAYKEMNKEVRAPRLMPVIFFFWCLCVTPFLPSKCFYK